MKTCNHCKQLKPSEAFAKSASEKDGLQRACRECRKRFWKPYNQKYYQENKTFKDATTKAYYQAHPEKKKEHYQKAYKKSGTAPYVAAWHRRRVIINKAVGSFTPEEFNSLCTNLNWRCFYCGTQLTPRTAVREHFIPLSKGGDNTISNILPSCNSCNASKGAKLVSYQKLLDRPVTPTPPEVLLCVDPGHTTGWAAFHRGLPYKCGQIPHCDENPGKLAQLLDKIHPTLVVYEQFVLYPWRMQQQSWSELKTVQIIGVLRHLCRERGIPTYAQGAGTAKGFCTDAKLLAWGFYQKGKPHSRDAIRHGVQYLLFGPKKEKGK